MPRAQGQIDIRKTQAVLDAASEVLAERGVGASIEEIARRAGVSKQTIYNHYGSKTDLIRTLVDRRRNSLSAAIHAAPASQPTEVTLSIYAGAVLQAITSPASIQLTRMAISGVQEMPDLARAVHEAGAGASNRDLAAYLDGRPDLEIANAKQAADVFMGMAIGRLHTKLLMGLEGVERDVLIRRGKEAARRFVRAYRRDPGERGPA